MGSSASDIGSPEHESVGLRVVILFGTITTISLGEK